MKSSEIYNFLKLNLLSVMETQFFSHAGAYTLMIDIMCNVSILGVSNSVLITEIPTLNIVTYTNSLVIHVLKGTTY